ncbi:MAG: hypothetical protein GXY24_06040 [Bacteroidales bacterium]|nr:hypothetical protein [Bacteroidales bacterium]
MENRDKTARICLSAGILLLILASCASQRKLGTLQREQMGATLRLPADRTALPTIPTGGVPRRDTLRVTDLQGREMILMQAIRDEETGEMVAAERLDAAVVTARFRNVAERHGRIDLEFQVVVPQQLQDSRWQLRLHPDLYLLEDSLRLDDVVITGADYRKAQLRGYEQYEKFLGRIVTDTLAFVDLRNLEIFLERNIPQVYALKTDSSYVSDELFASYFGVSEQEAVEHYTNKFLLRRNERRKADRERMFRKYVKAPLVTDGIRLDTVIRGSSGEFIYNYVQTITTRPKLRKADIRLCGEIFEQDRRLYTVPQSDPLTFYISSVSSFVDGTERYKTVILSRNLEANTSSNIDFRTGRHEIEEKLGDNAREISYIKENLRNLLLNETYELDSVTIAASASPEGSVSSNNSLTYRRSRAASDYFERYIQYVRDSVRREDGAIIQVGDDFSEGAVRTSDRASREIRFLSRSGGENWLALDDFVQLDSLMTEAQKEDYFRLQALKDPDEREKRMRGESWYKHLTEQYYPRLRTVRFTFALHRKGMVKDTVHTTELDSAYMRGIEAIRDHEYERALDYLTPYQDYNTAVAYVALDRNVSAQAILRDLPRTAPVNYMLALLSAREGDEQQAVQHYLDACGQDRSYVSRGNLDPEISALIRKYALNQEEEEDWGDLIY